MQQNSQVGFDFKKGQVLPLSQSFLLDELWKKRYLVVLMSKCKKCWALAFRNHDNSSLASPCCERANGVSLYSLDTYMSHEGVLYCKPHHKELFQPKVVKSDIIDVENPTQSQEAILRHQEQQRRMETIIRENNPVGHWTISKKWLWSWSWSLITFLWIQVDLGDSVVKCSTNDKFSGLDNLDVGAKYKMFESASAEPEEPRGPSSDR